MFIAVINVFNQRITPSLRLVTMRMDVIIILKRYKNNFPHCLNLREMANLFGAARVRRLIMLKNCL